MDKDLLEKKVDEIVAKEKIDLMLKEIWLNKALQDYQKTGKLDEFYWGDNGDEGYACKLLS